MNENINDFQILENKACCFLNRKKTEDWHADFTGKMNVLETGHHWVSVSFRENKKGHKFVVVTIKKFDRVNTLEKN